MASRPFFQVFLYLYTIFAGPAVMAKTGFPSFPIPLKRTGNACYFIII